MGPRNLSGNRLELMTSLHSPALATGEPGDLRVSTAGSTGFGNSRWNADSICRLADPCSRERGER